MTEIISSESENEEIYLLIDHMDIEDVNAEYFSIVIEKVEGIGLDEEMVLGERNNILKVLDISEPGEYKLGLKYSGDLNDKIGARVRINILDENMDHLDHKDVNYGNSYNFSSIIVENNEEVLYLEIHDAYVFDNDEGDISDFSFVISEFEELAIDETYTISELKEESLYLLPINENEVYNISIENISGEFNENSYSRLEIDLYDENKNHERYIGIEERFNSESLLSGNVLLEKKIMYISFRDFKSEIYKIEDFVLSIKKAQIIDYSLTYDFKELQKNGVFLVNSDLVDTYEAILEYSGDAESYEAGMSVTFYDVYLNHVNESRMSVSQNGNHNAIVFPVNEMNYELIKFGWLETNNDMNLSDFSISFKPVDSFDFEKGKILSEFDYNSMIILEFAEEGNYKFDLEYIGVEEVEIQTYFGFYIDELQNKNSEHYVINYPENEDGVILKIDEGMKLYLRVSDIDIENSDKFKLNIIKEVVEEVIIN